MTQKENFTAEEWRRVVSAPMLASIAMTAAEPGGLWGVVRESVAAAGAMRDAARSSDNALIGEIAAEYETSHGRDLARSTLKEEASGKPPAEVVDSAIAALGAVSGLVAEKAPGQAPGFTAWLRDIAARVAEAGTEGGFLGFGGEKVSANERATLERLATALA